MKHGQLMTCPICHANPKICEDIQDMFIFCSEDCPAPKCAHHNPKDTALSWNDWARWYRMYTTEMNLQRHQKDVIETGLF